MENRLKKETEEIQRQLNGKTVSQINLPKPNDLCVEFTDGTRLFVTASSDSNLDFSITGGRHE